MEIEELASFLGIAPTEAVVNAKREMCRSAADFVAHAEDRGIYAAAVSLRPFNGIPMNWFRPTSFPWLRTLEELGFPLLHPTTVNEYKIYTTMVSEWFVNCDTWPDCPDDTTGEVSVDLWLLNSRTYATVLKDVSGSKARFPDPAFVAEQFTYRQFNDVATSYTNIARYLDDIVAATSDIQRVHTDAIGCAENVDVTSPGFTNRETGGLAGTFACRGTLQSLYTECPEDVPPVTTVTTNTTNTTIAPAEDDTADAPTSVEAPVVPAPTTTVVAPAEEYADEPTSEAPVELPADVSSGGIAVRVTARTALVLLLSIAIAPWVCV